MKTEPFKAVSNKEQREVIAEALARESVWLEEEGYVAETEVSEVWGGKVMVEPRVSDDGMVEREGERMVEREGEGVVEREGEGWVERGRGGGEGG